MQFLTHHPDLISFRRMLLTIPSQPSSRRLDQESTFPGRTSIHVRDIVKRQIIQKDHFRAIMVDLEPTVVDEVRSTRSKSVANISVLYSSPCVG